MISLTEWTKGDAGGRESVSNTHLEGEMVSFDPLCPTLHFSPSLSLLGPIPLLPFAKISTLPLNPTPMKWDDHYCPSPKSQPYPSNLPLRNGKTPTSSVVVDVVLIFIYLFLDLLIQYLSLELYCIVFSHLPPGRSPSCPRWLAFSGCACYKVNADTTLKRHNDNAMVIIISLMITNIENTYICGFPSCRILSPAILPGIFLDFPFPHKVLWEQATTRVC